MPRRKGTKSSTSLPSKLREKKCPTKSRRKKYNSEIHDDTGKTSNFSAQSPQKKGRKKKLYEKSTLHSLQLNHTGPTPYKENEKEEDEGFGLSPAYLCECTLQTQDASVVPDDLPNKIQEEKSKTNPLKRKKSVEREITINKKIKSKGIKERGSNCRQEYSPVFLSESILQTEDVSIIPVSNPLKSNISEKSVFQNNQMRKGKRQCFKNIKVENASRTTNKSKKFSSEYAFPNKLYKDISLFLVPGSSNSHNLQNKEPHPPKRKELQYDDKKSCSNSADHNIHDYSPMLFCESILTSGDSSAELKFDPSKTNYSGKSFIKPNTKKAAQGRSKQFKNNNIKHSEGTKSKIRPGVCESDLLKDTFTMSSITGRDPCSLFQKRRNKLQHKISNNKEINTDINKSVMVSKCSSEISETSLEKFSANKVKVTKVHLKTKPQCRNKNQKSNNLSSGNMANTNRVSLEKSIKSNNMSEVPKYKLTKEKLSTNRLHGANLKNNNSSQTRSKGPKNIQIDSPQNINSENLTNGIVQGKDTSRISKADHHRGNLSKNTNNNTKHQLRSKKMKNNEKRDGHFSSQLTESSVSPKVTPRALTSKHSKGKNSAICKREPFGKSKKCTSNKIKNKTHQLNLVGLDENRTQSKYTLLALESKSEEKSYSKCRLPENPPKDQQKPQKTGKLQTNEVQDCDSQNIFNGTLETSDFSCPDNYLSVTKSYILKQVESGLPSPKSLNISESDSFNNLTKELSGEKSPKTEEKPSNTEVKSIEMSSMFMNDKALHAAESTFPPKFDCVMKCSSINNNLSEKRTEKDKEELQRVSEEDFTNFEISNNQGNIMDEISFIECTSLDHELKLVKSPESMIEKSDVDHITSEKDPLEWQSDDIALEKHRESSSETAMMKDKFSKVILSTSTDLDFLACDLQLECTLEDPEPSETDFQDSDYDSDGSNVFGSGTYFDNEIPQSVDMQSSNDIKCNSKTFTALPNITSETFDIFTEENRKIETKLLGNPDYKNGNMNCVGLQITSKSQVSNIILKKESAKEQSQEKNVMQATESKSCLQPNHLDLSLKLSISEDIKKSIPLSNIKYESEIHEILDKLINLVEISEISMKEKLGTKLELENCSQFKNQPIEAKLPPLENNKLMFASDIVLEVNKSDCTEEDCENKIQSDPVRNSSGEKCDRREILPPEQFKKISKELLNSKGEPVLRVLLHRLEDEEIFRMWKKYGVVLVGKHSKTKKGKKQKYPLTSDISKSSNKRKTFRCFVCKKNFMNRDRFWEHRASKCDRVRVFGCENCNNKYILKKMLEEHKAKCLAVKYFRCKECLKLFNSQERLDEHNTSKCDTQKVFVCDVCDRGFIFKRLLLIHKTPICTSLRRYQCSICCQHFDKLDLKTHKLKEHGIGVTPDLLCEFCGKLVNGKRFNDHKFSKHSDFPLYRCTSCSKVFRSREALHQHEFVHFDTKPCICADCGRAFKKLRDLKKHVSGSGTSFKCFTCGKVIQNQFCFRDHIKRHNKVEGFNGDGLKLEIKKEPLDEEYASNINNEEQLKFSTCEEFFTEKIKIEQNVDSSLNKTERFECDRCDSQYTRRRNLNDHLRRAHNLHFLATPVLEDKPFKCDICGNSFFKKINLNRHRKRMHKAPPIIIAREVKSPTKEKPYPCDICGTCISSKKNLKRHLKRMHHIISGNPSYPCTFCDEKFNTDDCLKKHTFEHFKHCFLEANNMPNARKQFPDDKVLVYNIKSSSQENLVSDINGQCFGENINLNRHQQQTSIPLSPSSLSNEMKNSNNYVKDHGFDNTNELYVNLKVEENMLGGIDVKKNKSLFVESNLRKPKEESTDNKEGENCVSSLIQCTRSLNEQTYLENNPSSSSENKSKIYSCKECGKTFNSGFSVKRHVCLHKINALQSTIGREIHACEECGIIFFEKWRLNKHLRSHGPQTLKCDICKKCFTTQLKLSIHMLVHSATSGAEPTFQSSKCKKLFPSSKKLTDHLTLHSEQNLYKCTKCNRTFTTLFSLKRHDKNTHSNKRFLCSFCNMSFISFSSLNKHVTYVHKKTVSLTEYVLRIEDDMQDESPIGADEFFENNSDMQDQNSIQNGNLSFNKDDLQIQTPKGTSLQADDSNYLFQVQMPIENGSLNVNNNDLQVQTPRQHFSQINSNDLQNQPTTEDDYLMVNNIQGLSTAEVNLQPQVFANICNMFMNSSLFNGPALQPEKLHRQDLDQENENVINLTVEKESISPHGAIIQILDQ